MDRLADQCSRPYRTPALLSAWWRHAAPAQARLRVVAVSEGGEVIGVGPFFLTTERLRVRTLRTLGPRASHDVEPLAAPSRELEVAAAIAGALAASPAPPDVVSFDAIARRSRWPGDLARAWPGGPAATLNRFELPSTSGSRHHPREIQRFVFVATDPSGGVRTVRSVSSPTTRSGRRWPARGGCRWRS